MADTPQTIPQKAWHIIMTQTIPAGVPNRRRLHHRRAERSGFLSDAGVRRPWQRRAGGTPFLPVMRAARPCYTVHRTTTERGIEMHRNSMLKRMRTRGASSHR